MDFDHNKLIAKLAKQVLLPAGLKRKGQSRSYYDDNGWWSTKVEFQPSGFSKGSYLNVGVSWLLYEDDSWGFDIGYRENEFSSAENEAEFTTGIFEMAIHAKEIAEKNRERFATVSKAHEYYQSIRREGWDFYYGAVIAGLNHEFANAKQNFNSWLAYPERSERDKEVNARCRALMHLLDRPKEFIEAVVRIVLNKRALLRLESKEPSQLGLPSPEEF
jgi:hypothetical protein